MVRSKQGVHRFEFHGPFHGFIRLLWSWVLGSITLAKFIRVGIIENRIHLLIYTVPLVQLAAHGILFLGISQVAKFRSEHRWVNI